MADQQPGPGGEVPRATADLVRELQNPDAAARRAVLERLAERYWKPVYCSLRRSAGTSGEDAKDLTQAFFAWLLNRDLLGRYDPARSSFRDFLKGLLRTFEGDEQQAARRLKRVGEGVEPLPMENPASSDPDVAFDAAFLKDAVEQAVRRVRGRFQAGGRIAPFAAFEQYYLSTAGPPPTYAIVARRLGIKEGDVRNYLHEVREAVREEVRSVFRGDGGEAPGEVAALFK